MYVDADVIFAVLKPNDRHLDFARKIINSKEKLYTSTVTFVELEIVLKRELSDFLSQNVLTLVLEKIPVLEIIHFDKKILDKSLELRKQFGVGIFDSIHAATALLYDKKIASSDHIFDRINSLKRIKPD